MPGNSQISSASDVDRNAFAASTSDGFAVHEAGPFTRTQSDPPGRNTHVGSMNPHEKMVQYSVEIQAVADRLRRTVHQSDDDIRKLLDDLPGMEVIQASGHDPIFQRAFRSAMTGDRNAVMELEFRCQRLSRSYASMTDSLAKDLIHRESTIVEASRSGIQEQTGDIVGLVEQKTKRKSVRWILEWTAADNLRRYFLNVENPTRGDAAKHCADHVLNPEDVVRSTANSLQFGSSSLQRNLVKYFRAGFNEYDRQSFVLTYRNAADDRALNSELMGAIFNAAVMYKCKNGTSEALTWNALREFIPRAQQLGYDAFLTQSENYVAATEEAWDSLGRRQGLTARKPQASTDTMTSGQRPRIEESSELPSTKRRKTEAPGWMNKSPQLVQTSALPGSRWPSITSMPVANERNTTATGSAAPSNLGGLHVNGGDMAGPSVPRDTWPSTALTASSATAAFNDDSLSQLGEFGDARRKYLTAAERQARYPSSSSGNSMGSQWSDLLSSTSTSQASSVSSNTLTNVGAVVSAPNISMEPEQSVSNDVEAKVSPEVSLGKDVSLHLDGDPASGQPEAESQHPSSIPFVQ